MSDLDDLLYDVADQLRNRFYGKYRGTVSDVDPDTLRIRAVVPAVLGTLPTDWCLPCVPYAGPDVGLFLIPDVGAAVWIEFEGGDVSLPIWSGCFWREGELPADAAATVRGLVTAAPHKLLFDDESGSVTLADSNDNAVSLDAVGITHARGPQSLVVGDASVSVNDGAMTVI
ncbi:baseplate assembly protein [Catellatospora sp. TT07R-123]|uniref:phage baseplate assembly protein V n=1 Tax=Catellatospora sp. TT07R-123 TaxID=2733863 RepID=UPI001B00152B|nr:phage baseplate assembly protein V [Catellatospora sp. TT07R-123]GHJ47491.1 baseplate assembly protein [Catellatospora sp. TT07R-123]